MSNFRLGEVAFLKMDFRALFIDVKSITIICDTIPFYRIDCLFKLEENSKTGEVVCYGVANKSRIKMLRKGLHKPRCNQNFAP